MIWGRLLFEGATIAYNAVFRGGYYSIGTTNSKGDVYSRKYGILILLTTPYNLISGFLFIQSLWLFAVILNIVKNK